MLSQMAACSVIKSSQELKWICLEVFHRRCAFIAWFVVNVTKGVSRGGGVENQRLVSGGTSDTFPIRTLKPIHVFTLEFVR